jgi:hypothetical protein
MGVVPADAADATSTSTAKTDGLRRRFAQAESARRPLRGICLGVTDRQTRPDGPSAAPAGQTAELSRRPDTRALSRSIPLFFIGRNRTGLWVAREAEGRTGGIFLFRASALRFAARNSAPKGCATMFLGGRIELDVENRGHRVTGLIAAALGAVARRIPEYPPAIPIMQKKQKGAWQ